MITTAREFLESFDSLPEPEKQQITVEILRRSASPECGLSDEALALAGEELFLAIDAAE